MIHIFKISCVLLLLITAQRATACDLCGCGAGGDYAFGILPQFHRNMVGLRYAYRQYASTHPIDLSQATPTTTAEQYQTLDIVGRWYLAPRLLLQANVP